MKSEWSSTRLKHNISLGDKWSVNSLLLLKGTYGSSRRIRCGSELPPSCALIIDFNSF